MQRLQQRTQNAIKHADRQAKLKYRRRKIGNRLMGQLDPEFPQRLQIERDRKREEKLEKRKERETMEHFAKQFKIGGRVCLVAPRDPDNLDRGRISTVTEIRHAEKACFVDGLSDISDLDDYERFSSPQPIPMSSLRPVKTIWNPIIRRPEDIIMGLDKDNYPLEESRAIDPKTPFSEESTEAATKRAEEERYEERATLETKAEKEEEKRLKAMRRPKWLGPEASQNNEHDIDTLRVDVEARTWTPSLIRVPFPDGVIDELRGKYSRFRNNHDPEYIQKVEENERKRLAREAYLKNGGNMLVSPLKQLSLQGQKKRQDSQESQTGMPSPQLLELIGRKMVERGAVKPKIELSEEAESSAARIQKSLPIAAAEQDRRVKEKKRIAREAAKLYWPLKGWKEKQRMGGKKITPPEFLSDNDARGDATKVISERR
ncbi:uncharacterized protein KY384_006822 [Bacidia gigantensis]|uniref:uncharacterized protein n=1 Tax=Bacidia gigantensis TaxID=2732470 RepID=UPI001D04C89B|nr:uncharacterized protein KY384_006822 [Bacidia gigantensis]KAG8527906.1 hypothetical protein KY384_006822 [Bacidia gigantensis]